MSETRIPIQAMAERRDGDEGLALHCGLVPDQDEETDAAQGAHAQR
ncbi:MAG: hypothetical protein IPN48_04960 [Sphingomonadales bacterium]|nr:hypothetical protein [Sphingomonadales bacterium]